MPCITPIRIKAKKKVSGGNWDGVVKEEGYSVVPCGKCPECKKKRAQAWIFRLLKEEKIHKNSLFVTLTYAPENVPISNKGFMTLRKRDYQLFMKNLRNEINRNPAYADFKKLKVKYYACGEYGSDTWRPHYHAIMYDTPPDAVVKAWSLGHVHIGNVSGDSIAYTTKYICKEKRVPVHSNDDRVPEFSLMSKNLGKNYLTLEAINWHRTNAASYVVLEGGYTQALPRYYRDFIFSEDERELLNVVNQHKARDNFQRAVYDAGSEKEFYRLQFERAKDVQQRNKYSNHNRNKI